jgi:hypothetical protein
MAFFQDSAREVYLKIHFNNHGVKRVSPLSIEFSELTSFIGLKSAIIAEVKGISAMSAPVFAYQDEEGDYVDLIEKHYHRFLKFVSLTDSNINIKVFEEAPEPPMCDPPQRNYENQLTAQQETFDLFETFTYQTPIEHSLSNSKQDILELEVQCESASEHLQSLKNKFCASVVSGFGKQCSNCHLKLDHNARHCRLEKCVSSQQCGDINKHQDEKSMVESAHDFFKKIQKELKSKTVEYETKLKAVESVKNSFPEKIRCHLINSNKSKYLVEVSDGSFLPRSGIVNCDIANLEKYYNGKCPDNLDRASALFGTILSNFDKMATTVPQRNNANAVKRSLEESTIYPVKFPKRTPSATHPNPESIYQRKGINYTQFY